MALTQITTSGLANGAVTSSKISNTVQLGGPTISQIQITDSSYNVLDDTAVSTNGGYIKITGTGFEAGAQVIINSTSAISVGFVSSTVLNVQVPAFVAGTYIVYVVNASGSVGIKVNGLTYSEEPIWITGSSLPQGVANQEINIQLSSTGDQPITYALAEGNVLPTGLTLSSSGLISGTVTDLSVETLYTFTIVATDNELQDSPRTFTINIAIGDPYFYLTTLLLPGNGTNNGTNNTFLDGSNNNFTITRNGNTTQGTFSPFSLTGWSGYFDENGDFLSIPHNSSINLSSGDFTIEAYVWWNGLNSSATVVDKDGAAGSSYPSYNIDLNGSSRIRFTIGSGNGISSIQALVSSESLPINQWVHVAAVKNATTLTLYQNGNNVASATQTATIIDGGKAVLIGYHSGQPAANYWNGYISNVRIVKGTALYTANFTPPTSPLTAIANTQLLTCQSNRFIDNSTNNFTITGNGDVSVQSFSPFNPTSAYSTSVVGGSAYFDGNADFLSLSNNSAFLFGNGNFTIECYAYMQIGGSLISIWDDFSTNPQSWHLYASSRTTSTTIRFLIDVSGSDTVVLISDRNIPINQWTHIAVTRSGNSWYMFFNGQLVATTTNSSTIFNGTGPLCIGGYSGASASHKESMTGYISGLRILKGTALYTSEFTPPIAPLTNIANTSLLCNFTNGQITDSTSKNVLETVGDARVSTAEYKYGTGSIYLDGTGDYIKGNQATSDLYAFQGDFTIEMWVKSGSTTSVGGAFPTIFATSAFNGTGLGIKIQGTGGAGTVGCACVWYNNSQILTGTNNIADNNWHHIAVTRNGSAIRLFVDGTQQANTTSTASFTVASGYPIIGADTTSTGNLDGYIDDLRVTKGYARYTANFTPPTSAFLLQ